MAAAISLEQQREQLIEKRVANTKQEADGKAYALNAMVTPLRDLNWRTLMALSAGQTDPKLAIAMAFRDLAESAEKIGTLNITPDLLETLLDAKPTGPAAAGAAGHKQPKR